MKRRTQILTWSACTSRYESPSNDRQNEAKRNTQVPTKSLAWPSSGFQRASISNFGFGGTNSHVILEKAKPRGVPNGEVKAKNPSRQLFVLSAQDKVSVIKAAANLRKHLEDKPDTYSNSAALAEIAYTLGERRTRFPWTVTVNASTVDELAEALENPQAVQNSGTSPRIGLVFNGQGMLISVTPV
jgi:acyl transferase domain-containing protein